MAAALVDEETRYDTDKYLELLISAGANILSPFGYTFEELYRRVVQNQKQTMLS
jgi:DNA polymerase elongation subunit (family B)